ncbi:uncharacterized protein LOC135090615 [Scylla paramamosain]|uniref:uncharacterized protein LOC135090615 n=1 Tax=Scylla paramamosain TaxID=85552 RepID=UPI003082E0BD
MGDSGDTGGHAGGGRGPRLPLLLSLCLLLLLLLLLPASTACPAACSCEAARQGLWSSLRDVAAPPPDTNTVAVTCKSAGLKAPPDHLALNGLNSSTVIKLDLSFNNLTELKPRAPHALPRPADPDPRQQ